MWISTHLVLPTFVYTYISKTFIAKGNVLGEIHWIEDTVSQNGITSKSESELTFTTCFIMLGTT